MSVFAHLKSDRHQAWTAYTRHAFVHQLGEGTLSQEAFRDYLVQDYLFLLHFARAEALAAYKSRTFAGVREQIEGAQLILNETLLHVGFAQKWGVTAQEMEAAAEKQATVAYTRYVIDTGLAGDLAELNVALAPCVIGYAEIGRELEPKLAEIPDHPYREWIDMYAGAEFQAGARAAIDRLDRLVGDAGPQRLEELAEIFETASRLEADFWQQALQA